MNASDIEKCRNLIRRRDSIVSFVRKARNTRALMVSIPTGFELEIGRATEGATGVFIVNEEALIRQIAELANAAATREISEIESELTEYGVLFEPMSAECPQ